MIRIVLDTNVLISGMINAFGAPGRIVDLVREGFINGGGRECVVPPS